MSCGIHESYYEMLARERNMSKDNKPQRRKAEGEVWPTSRMQRTSSSYDESRAFGSRAIFVLRTPVNIMPYSQLTK